eukprot:568746-Amphidinium_carterae.1
MLHIAGCGRAWGVRNAQFFFCSASGCAVLVQYGNGCTPRYYQTKCSAHEMPQVSLDRNVSCGCRRHGCGAGQLKSLRRGALLGSAASLPISVLLQGRHLDCLRRALAWDSELHRRRLRGLPNLLQESQLHSPADFVVRINSFTHCTVSSWSALCSAGQASAVATECC